ncbi:hypothetical protein LTR36_010744 [Oleoguttula mirabilis]|uniref:Uncharacterized protein n=1 Tax=Oleoguttula mirabilis TaxID=1507867 RepID=A0AAV9JQW2_9PEZI|nr:hypothetical protein LTR36_010744 [Oleoguttula mirabilis]
MSRAFAAFGVGIAALVGIATSYVTFQPELQRQQEEKAGTFNVQHTQQNDSVISQAIISDFAEAKQQALGTSNTGPAWKLRQMLFGKNPEHPDNKPASADKTVVQQGSDDAKRKA